MNKRIVAINDTVHDRVQKLLPWFVVNTLQGEELALVNQHLNVCPECQADFAWQCKLQAVPPAANSAPDVDRAFARLRERIDTGAVRPAPGSGWLDQFRNRQLPWMQWALAAQLLLIIGLVVLIAVPGRQENYRALGNRTPTHANLVVVFRPDTSELVLRELINAAGARIVDGPTVTDAYLIQVPDEKLPVTLSSLRHNPHVTLAQPLQAGGQQ